MKLCLVALPWSLYRHPSAALGALSAYMRLHRPNVETVCRSAYVDVAVAIGIRCYDLISESSYEVGEMLYAPLVFPERKEEVRRFFIARMEAMGVPLGGEGRFLDAELYGEEPSWSSVFDVISAVLEARLEDIVDEIAGRYDLVGMTTCFGQLFANLAFGMRLARRSPGTKIVLGGSTISDRVGPSLLLEFPFIDYVIQGEGEQPLAALVDRLAEGTTDVRGIRGILSRDTAADLPAGAPLWEVSDVSALPIPNYDEYAVRAEEHNFLWFLTVEGSRGCWWDRAKRTGNPKNTCHFCNLNVQWSGYREKDTQRVIDEVVTLTNRYDNDVLIFVDNIIRAKGVEDFAERLIATGKDLVIFYEMRAHISPYELLLLWEAGLRVGVFGIEALSSSYLKRIGKGTSVIANLQAMKTCQELGITNNGNLLTEFPGATPEEVEETYQTVVDYALCYQPLLPNRYWLGRGSTIAVLHEEYGIGNLRNADFYRVGLPEEVFERIALLDLSYDTKGAKADWSCVYEACKMWNITYAAARSSEYQHLVTYLDNGSSMRIFDARSGALRNTILRGLARDLYMYCLEIRSFTDIRQQFIDSGVATEQGIKDLLDGWIASRLVFREARGAKRWEGSRFLAIAPAFTPRMAARRIRAAHQADLLKKRAAQAPLRLPLV